MQMIRSFRRWWQVNSRQQETPFDGDAPYWVVSLLFHLGLLCALTLVFLPQTKTIRELSLLTEPEVEEEEDLSMPQEFHFSQEFKEDIGAQSEDGDEMALSQDIIVAQDSLVKMPLDSFENENAELWQNDVRDDPKSFELATTPIKGFVGESSTGAEGAIDRITHEILVQMQERKTLVVWVFDQSASLTVQRSAIKERIERVYEELGVIEASGEEAFHKEQPLLTSVYAFGNQVIPMQEPTADFSKITDAIDRVERDDTGIERVFTAVGTVAKKFQGYRRVRRSTKEPDRNVMIVVITDEAGDDVDAMDSAIKFCRSVKIPVYVIGVPAPFGRKATPVKWIDPDPEYDQTPQWSYVNQGPESLMPERIKLHFAGQNEDSVPVDSGFGPFALTRLCYETGGIYFAVHPNRNFNGRLKNRNVAAYSSHMARFFDSEVMRKYRPDYTTLETYWNRVRSNSARAALVQAAQQSWVSQMKEPQLYFEKKDEAAFVQAINLAQRSAAVLSPQVNLIYEILKKGEADRPEEINLRWQAGYDLAMGRVMAVKVRTDAYNVMLAQAKTGLKPVDPRTNIWELVPSNKVTAGSRMSKFAEKAREYLQRVVNNHSDTPWALMAQRELDTPIGWEWVGRYDPPPPPPKPRPAAKANPTPPPPPRPNIPRAARNEAKKMLAPPKKRRPPPKL